MEWKDDQEKERYCRNSPPFFIAPMAVPISPEGTPSPTRVHIYTKSIQGHFELNVGGLIDISATVYNTASRSPVA